MIDKLALGWRGLRAAVIVAALLALSAEAALSLDRQDVMDCEDISDVNRMIEGCTKVVEDKRVPANLRSMVLVRRGFGYFTLHKVEDAIADFRDALSLDPTNNGAYNELGLALQEKGDTEGAIVALSQAVKLAPESAASRFNRGNMYLRAGKPDEAIQDYSDAIKLGADPSTVFADDGKTERPVADRILAGYFAARGTAHFLNENFQQSIADFGRAASFPNPEGYDAIWLSLAHKRAGTAGGEAELETLLKSEDGNAWPKPVAALMLGRMTPDQVLSAAAKAVETCEAHFYIGQMKLAAADAAGARDELTIARDTCPKTEREYAGAVIQLTRLK